MNANRANLDEPQNNKIYIILSVVFFILSVVGIFAIFQINNSKLVSQQVQNITPTVTPEVTISPEVSPILTPEEIIPSPLVSITPIATFTASISATKTKISPTLKPTSVPKISLTPTPTATASAKASGFLIYRSTIDNFSVSYLSYRKVYQDKENGGNRYTFYSTKGSFAIHAGSDWSWIYSERSFNSNFTVNNLPTSRYETDSQTLVDFENQSKKYTIQCIHNGISSLKTECENFIQSFKFL